jgi:beta-lactamase superfamily II metal-dependent hydrolase
MLVKGVSFFFFPLIQGDCCFIKIEYGTSTKWIMLDSGGNMSNLKHYIGHLVEKEKLHHLDFIFISHNDHDHAGALTELVEVAKVYTNLTWNAPYVVQSPKYNDMFKNHTFQLFLNVCKGKKEPKVVQDKVIRKSLGFDGHFIRVIPSIHKQKSSENTYCFAVNLVLGNSKFMFPGDASAKNLDTWVLNDVKGHFKDCVLSGVSHHGASECLSSAYFEHTNSQHYFCQGAMQKFKHPHCKVIEAALKQERCISVLTTSEVYH